MPDVLLELVEGEIAPLLDHVDGAVFINISPGVEASEVPQRSALGNLFGNRGPTVPLATWTPGEIGLQHMAGQRVARFLSERGCPVPDEWYVVADHPKRGLVLRTYRATPEETLRWLAQATRLLCPLEIVHPWQAVVRTR